MKRKKLTAYLAGAMEAAVNLGAGWRTEITPFLKELDFEVLNPCEFEPHQLKGLKPNRLPEFYTDGLSGKRIKPNHWHEMKNAVEPNLNSRFRKYMQRIIRYDINLIKEETDIVIVFWDENAGKGAGTHAEMTVAHLHNIPVYCVADCDIPAWLKATCSEVFLTFDALKAQLTEDFE